MKKYRLTALLLLAMVYNTTAQQQEFSWLLGTWKLKDKDVFESWSLARDGKSLEGISYRVKVGDTIVMETIRLTYEAGSFHYVPDVAGDQGPVSFRITRHDTKGFVAENPRHDFPKIIRYSFKRADGNDHIEASIEGNGKSMPYQFERIR